MDSTCGRTTLYSGPRIVVATEVFHAGTLAGLIVRGDHYATGYDEPTSMTQAPDFLGLH